MSAEPPALFGGCACFYPCMPARKIHPVFLPGGKTRKRLFFELSAGHFDQKLADIAADASAAKPAISTGIFSKILLMIVLGVIKRF